jgi:hypothetical protein
MTAFDREALRDRIADWLVDMEPLFDRRCKLTFVMRAPHLPDGDLIVTADNIDAVIVALQRLRGYEEIRSPLAPAPGTTP